MLETMKKFLFAGLGVTSLTRDKIEEIVDELVKRGKVSAEEKEKIIDELIKVAEKKRADVKELIRGEVKKILKSLDIPTRSDFEEIKKEIEKISKQKDVKG